MTPGPTPKTTDLLDPDDAELWDNYLESCRRLGVEPVTRDRARDLVAEWSAVRETRREAAAPILVWGMPEWIDGPMDAVSISTLIAAGKPTQNAYIESFNRKFRDECLNDHHFNDLARARAGSKHAELILCDRAIVSEDD